MLHIKENLISERDFDDVWGAKVKPDGTLLAWMELASLPANRVWTVYEIDDVRDDGKHYLHWCATPGVVPSLALGYLVTEKSWGMDTPDAIWFYDDDEHGAAERHAVTQELK